MLTLSENQKKQIGEAQELFESNTKSLLFLNSSYDDDLIANLLSLELIKFIKIVFPTHNAGDEINVLVHNYTEEHTLLTEEEREVSLQAMLTMSQAEAVRYMEMSDEDLENSIKELYQALKEKKL